MYETRYNLKTRPFNLAPTIQNFFAADGINQAVVQARTCIERESGPVIITGTPGTGKSLLLAMLEKQYSNTHRVVRLQCARLVERGDLLQSILYELGLQYRDLSEGELRLSLIDFLKTDDSQGLLLLVDEAHGLSTGLLDELRLITNFVRDGRQRVALVMSGSPALEDHLIDTRCESFNQRIAARCYLGTLTQKETFEYVLTHIERAGGNGEELFTDQALSSVHEFSEGCPRVINQICDHSLMIAAQCQASRVSAEIVKEAWNQVQSMPGANMPGAFSTSGSIELQQEQPHPVEPLSQNQTDSDMVIEFGQLDVEESQPVSDELNRDTIVSIDSSQPTEVESWPTSRPEDQFVDTSENLIPIDFPNSKSTDSAQWHIHEEAGSAFDAIPAFGADPACDPNAQSIHSADEPIVVDSNSIQIDFENPFDEEFSEVERIESGYIPAVAEQNISSLTLHPEQLSFLNEMPARSEIGSTPEMKDLQEHGVQPGSQNIQEADLKISEDSLPSVEEIEADVVRMQRDIYTQTVETGGFQEPISTDVGNPVPHVAAEAYEPLASASETDSESEPEPFAIPDVAAIAREIARQDAEYQAPEEPPIQIEERQASTADDRDMMVVEIQNDPTLASYNVNRATDRSVPITSTGIAKRMDYQELFQQLRNQNQQ